VEISVTVNVPRIKEAKQILECKVNPFMKLKGNRLILVGKVLHAEVEKLGLDTTKPLLHESGEKFRSIGKKLVFKRRR
jgi:flavin reductase (DIM6/NTAB) family NADH-FMN oxidoreductase RutF